MNKNRRTTKQLIAEKQAEKEKIEKELAKLKKEENSRPGNKNSWKGEIGDTSFAMIYQSLFTSAAFMDLKPKSVAVYIGMLSYSQGNYHFEYPHSMYKNICSNSTFQTAVIDLVEHGFIEKVSSGKFNRKPNVFRFSDKFHNWKKN